MKRRLANAGGSPRFVLVPTLFLVLATVAAAVLGSADARGAGPVDVYDFPDPEAEVRYRNLIDEFRCPKCLNTNLSGSDAPIAKDLRRTVHRLLVAEGLTDDEIRKFLQQRYGDFVLYRPPFRPGTWLLWLAPAGFVLMGLIILWRVIRQPPARPLSSADLARLHAIVEED